MAGRHILEELRHFKELAFINGQWINGAKGKTFPVLNPSSGEVIANVPDLFEDDINNAINGANDAFQQWRSSTCGIRSNLLNNLARKTVESKQELATIITMECGKPIQESLVEVNYAASFLEWYAGEAKRINGDVLPISESSIRRLILRQPVGVCGLITPWNSPLAMLTRKLGAVLAAGCSAVLKPSEETPLTALAFGKLIEDAEIPSGLVNIITCSRDNAELAGRVLCQNKIINKISFTGSSNVGKLLMEKSAPTMKRVSMELGGNAPLIVFDSADAKLAAISAMKCKFRNSGQACICAERIFVQNGIYDEFMEEFKKAVNTLKAGDPFDMTTTLSCVINDKALQKVQDHVSDAISHDASIICGGKLAEEGTLKFLPTIIANCHTGMKCIQEEIFGPIAPVFRFHTEEEVIALANTHNSGLAGYFFSNDFRQIWRISEKLEVGMVGVNEAALPHETIPHGGIKESGIGREGSIYGINE